MHSVNFYLDSYLNKSTVKCIGDHWGKEYPVNMKNSCDFRQLPVMQKQRGPDEFRTSGEAFTGEKTLCMEFDF